MSVERDSVTGQLTGVYRDQGNRPQADVTLDPERQARAAQRARQALAAAEHHDTEAARERAKADSICRTWNLGQDKFGYPIVPEASEG